jgi:hypothetical protein
MRLRERQLLSLRYVSYNRYDWVEPLEAGKFLAAAFNAALNPDNLVKVN